MGLIKEFLLLPAAPLRFTLWVSDKVAEEVDRQHFSPAAGMRKLEAIEEARESGELEEEEAAQMEGEILEQQVERAQPAPEPEGGAEDG